MPTHDADLSVRPPRLVKVDRDWLRSIGATKLIVELLLPAILRSVPRWRSCMASGALAKTWPVCSSFSGACTSPSASITLARRRRSASACLDCTHHRLTEVDLLQLDIGDLDAPGVGLRIEDIRREILVELFARQASRRARAVNRRLVANKLCQTTD